MYKIKIKRNITTLSELNYITQDECSKIHAEKEKYYDIIIKQSVEDRGNIKIDIKELEGKLEEYKKTINGKFDKIMYSVISLLIVLLLGFGATIYSQVASKEEIDGKIKAVSEERIPHQQISQNNSDDLNKVMVELKEIKNKLK